MQQIPPQLLKQLPPQMANKLMQLHQQQLRTQSVVSDDELLTRIAKQWRPGASLLNYFQVDVPPRQPFTKDLTHFPPRSRYYETFVCTWTFAFSILLIHSLEYLLLGTRLGTLLKKCDRRATALQFLILTVPFQICVLDYPVKNYVNFVLPFNAICLCIYMWCLLLKRLRPSRRLSAAAASATAAATAAAEMDTDTVSLHRKPHFNDLLSIYRSIVYISTAVCIFARDQPCWNNDFSKTYSFGTGLMDVGIGCFVVCIGSLGPTSLRQLEDVNRSQAMRKAAVQAGILTACGLVKSLAVVIATTVRVVRFDESWREYGVHWNAFYSLAAARLLGTCLELLALPRRLPPLLAAVAVAAAHEAALAWGLAELVLAPGKTEPHNRSNLIGQNREGLASVPGLVTLYLAGLQLGRWTRDWTVAGGAGGGRHRLASSVRMLGLLAAALAWRPLLASGGGAGLVLPESRRLANPSYCAWVVAFSCFCILFAGLTLEARRLLMGHAMPADSAEERMTPLHLRQIDSAGLLYFLVSNLLTGIFNFFIDRTLSNREQTDGPACFLIILAYIAASFCITRAADSRLSFRLLQEKLMRLFSYRG